MMENWADVVAERMVGTDPLREGRLLLLGAADTGKTTLMSALVRRLAGRQPVALVDADIGQSHIGPPTTVGWTVIDKNGSPVPVARPSWPCLSRAGSPCHGGGATGGIAFVGDVTPVGHLLQLLAALTLCVEQARQAAKVVLIDTPGLVVGGAACSLWWTVQRLLRPERILAVERENELGELLGGLQTGFSIVEKVKTPGALRRKSPEARRAHREQLFAEYFRDATAYTLSLKDLAVRSSRPMTADSAPGCIVGLTDAGGQDLAIGMIERWQPHKAKMTIRAPQLDIRSVRCLTLGDVRLDIPFGWSG
jgi:polynucleotide 5'-hydroxyl-kinase GRC3/NOL9